MDQNPSGTFQEVVFDFVGRALPRILFSLHFKGLKTGFEALNMHKDHSASFD